MISYLVTLTKSNEWKGVVNVRRMTFYKFKLEFKKKKTELKKLKLKKHKETLKRQFHWNEWIARFGYHFDFCSHGNALDCFELPLLKLSITNKQSQCVSSQIGFCFEERKKLHWNLLLFILLLSTKCIAYPPQFNIDLDEWYQHQNENVNVVSYLFVWCLIKYRRHCRSLSA